MSEQLPAGKRGSTNILTYNTSTELQTHHSTYSEGNMGLTLDPPALYIRNEGAWVQVATPSGSSVGPASEAQAGIAELASQTETDTGTDDARIVTPLKLAGRTATEARTGVVEQATEAEVQAGTAGNLVATVARLKAELDRRLTPEAWTAPVLQNSWTNLGAGAEAAGYRKFLGEVQLRGVITGGTMTNGTVLLNLPAGYRPAASRYFIGLQGGNTACRFIVNAAGDLTIQGVTNNGNVSLESVRFDV